jgi:hypothetical protein
LWFSSGISLLERKFFSVEVIDHIAWLICDKEGYFATAQYKPFGGILVRPGLGHQRDLLTSLHLPEDESPRSSHFRQPHESGIRYRHSHSCFARLFPFLSFSSLEDSNFSLFGISNTDKEERRPGRSLAAASLGPWLLDLAISPESLWSFAWHSLYAVPICNSPGHHSSLPSLLQNERYRSADLDQAAGERD